MAFRYLIVGGGMTADAACRGVRDHDPDGSIGLVGEEPVDQVAVADEVDALDAGRAVGHAGAREQGVHRAAAGNLHDGVAGTPSCGKTAKRVPVSP